MLTQKGYSPLLILLVLFILLPNLTNAQQFREDRIYIDSVPRGATVSLLPEVDGKGKAVELGKTPLELDPARASSRRFVIMMNMEDYMKAIENLPGLKKWIERFRIEQFSGMSRGGHQTYFSFDVPTSQAVTDVNGRLVAIGPVYKLDYPRHHRLVALFIPRSIKASTFFPLMPSPGTFSLDPSAYGGALIRDYHFSPEQAAEAVGALSRCGKYVTTVQIPGITDKANFFILSAQKGYFVTQGGTIRIIPGYND